MPHLVTFGATLECSSGSAHSQFTVLPTNRVLAGGMPAATIMDHAPLMNIGAFGVCRSSANPTVAAATAAAGGTLTPMPCIPSTVQPWSPGSPNVMIGAVLALNSTCSVACMWGGTIRVAAPGQATTMLP